MIALHSRTIDPKDLFQKEPILQKINLNLCVGCKAVKQACGLGYCPLVKALDLHPKVDTKLETISDNSVFGDSPQIFVGSHGYPSVFTGPMQNLLPDSTNADKVANPALWTNLSIEEIIELRFGLLRGKQKTYIQPGNHESSINIKEKLEELSQSIKPVEVEGLYIKKPDLALKLNSETQPFGPSGFLSKFSLTSNPKIPRRVDHIINDEIIAHEQINTLYQDGFDVYYLQGIFSSGSTGMKANSKIVPSRWSITAIDDIIGKQLITKLRDFSPVSNIEVLKGDFLGNHFTICKIPGNWSYESYETWIPGSIFTVNSTKYTIGVDREGFTANEAYKGRTKYASAAGGYYATRLAILEYLHKNRNQARIVVFREILPDYKIPVGVWAVREGTRLALKSKPLKFNTKNELLKWLKINLEVDLQEYLKRNITFSQSSLDEYFW